MTSYQSRSLLLEKGFDTAVDILFILVTGRTPMRAALWAIFGCVVYVAAIHWIGLRDIVDGLEQGARGVGW